MEIQHVTIAADGRRPLFPDENYLRAAVRALSRVAGPYLVLFNLIDDHLHLVFACDRTRAGRLAQGLAASLRGIASVPLQSARILPVESRKHLERLVVYVLRQTSKHQVAEHPALWTGSCFQDLVGARYLDNLHIKSTIIKEMPRFRLRSVLRTVDLPTRNLVPVSFEDVFGLGIQRLVAAGATASAVGPKLIGRTAPVVQARAAIVAVGLTAGFTPKDLARVLDMTAHGVRRLALRNVPDGPVRAIRVRLALECVTA